MSEFVRRGRAFSLSLCVCVRVVGLHSYLTVIECNAMECKAKIFFIRQYQAWYYQQRLLVEWFCGPARQGIEGGTRANAEQKKQWMPILQFATAGFACRSTGVDEGKDLFS